MAIGISSAGPATATASSGAGTASSYSTSTASPGQWTKNRRNSNQTRGEAPDTGPNVAPISSGLDRARLLVDSRLLSTELVTDNDQPVLAAVEAVGGAGSAATGQTAPIQVQITMSAQPCGAGCAVAVSVSVGGTPHAQLLPAAPCRVGAGYAVAVAVATADSARATADGGADAPCAATTPAGGPVTASVGSTGDALGVSLADRGAATATVSSGGLGSATGGVTGTAPSDDLVDAQSGASGPADGVGVGLQSSTVTVSSGRSGDSTASCDDCAAGRQGLVDAVSGDTGLSYALSGSGSDAVADAGSGATGPATADASGPAGSTSDASYSAGRVIGRSGDTGDALAAAVDPASWVHVDTLSGSTGFVRSTIHGPTVGSPTPGTSRIRTRSGSSVHSVSAAAGTPSLNRGTPQVRPGVARRENHSVTTGAAPTAQSAAALGGFMHDLVVRANNAQPVSPGPRSSAPGRRPSDAAKAKHSAGSGVAGAATGVLVFAAMAALAVAAWWRVRTRRR